MKAYKSFKTSWLHLTRLGKYDWYRGYQKYQTFCKNNIQSRFVNITKRWDFDKISF